MKVLHLREKIPWFGGHSGYEQLTRNLEVKQAVSVVKPRPGLLFRYLGSSYARLRGKIGRGATSFSEFEFRMRRRLSRPDASHILYLENHFEMLEALPKARKDLVGTIHLPAHIWKPEQAALLSRLKSAVVLYQRDIPFFEQHAGQGKVRFIHHGADVDFFKPDPTKMKTPPRILYSGVYLRNEPMVVRVVNQLHEKNPEIKFDFLIPQHHRANASLKLLAGHPAITWHAGLNDEQLRDLYQQSYLMLLPMNDSGANTAVVEALTSGLPLATTDVGGIRDYGGGTIFPVIANNDDGGMVALVERYLNDRNWRDEVAQQSRKFTEEFMAWPLIAQKHLEFYAQLSA